MSIQNQKDHYAAIEDVHVNLENRNHAFDEYGYGPLNPKEPNDDFWKEKAETFNTTPDEAKKSRCGNCAAFNQSKPILNRISDALGPAGKVVTEKANLGFCELFKFKCAAERTCDAWLVNGPIMEEAPANSAGGGNVAGLGVGPQGEPGRSSSLMFKRGKFAGKDTFIVPTKMFHKGQLSKKKGQHWKSYFTEDEGFNEIREFAMKNPKKSIILQDENTGALYVAKYGSNV